MDNKFYDLIKGDKLPVDLARHVRDYIVKHPDRIKEISEGLEQFVEYNQEPRLFVRGALQDEIRREPIEPSPKEGYPAHDPDETAES